MILEPSMILWNAELAKRLSCSEADKATLSTLIKDMCALATKTRSEGVKSSLAEPVVVETPLLSYGFRMIAEGLAPEILEEVTAVYLTTGPSSGIEFLRQCVRAEALISIASGDSVDVTLRKLVPYCGADRAYPLLAELESNGIPARV